MFQKSGFRVGDLGDVPDGISHPESSLRCKTQGCRKQQQYTQFFLCSAWILLLGASLSLSQLCWTVIYNSAWQQSSDNLSKKKFLWIICRLWPEIRADTFRYMICFLAAVLFQSIFVTACDGKLLHHQGNESDWVTKTLPYSSPAYIHLTIILT